MITLIVSSFPAHASGPARQVVFQGISRSEVQKLQKKFPIYFKPNVTLEEIDDFVKELISSGKYESVSAYLTQPKSKPDPHVITIKLLSRREIQEILFEGLKEVAEDDLRVHLKIKEQLIFTQKILVEATQNIKAYYGSLGYLKTKIQGKVDQLESGSVRLRFQISEGELTRIKRVYIDSDNLDLNQKLRGRAAQFIGKPLSDSVSDELRRSITDFFVDKNYLKCGISDVKIHYSNGMRDAEVTFEIEDPFIYEIFFEGLLDFSPYQMRKIALENLGNIPLEDPPFLMVENVKRFYHKNGYSHAKIEYKQRVDPDRFARQITLFIEEHEKVRIREVHVSGRISRPSEYYVHLILENSGEVTEDGYYNQEEIGKGVENLKLHLQNEGFFQAKTTYLRPIFIDDGRRVDLELSVDEGPLTQVGKIAFSGNGVFSDYQLSQVIALKTGAPLKLSDFEESLSLLRNHYRDRGYLEMILLNEESLISYNETNTQASLLFHVWEGPQIQVGAISIEGNSLTKDYVITRRLSFQEGDILTPLALSESIRHLQRTGLFSHVEIATVGEGSQTARRTVVVHVVERNPGLFEFGFGVNNERKLTLRGFTGLAFRNIYGTARAISGRLELNSNVGEDKYLEHSFTSGYYEPFLFESQTSGRINITRNQEISEFNAATGKLTVFENNEINFLVERDFTSHFKGIWNILDISGIKTRTMSDPEASEDLTKVQQIVTTGPSLQWDYRDDPFVPKKGHLFRLFLQYSDPEIGSSSGIQFVKSTGSFSTYTPLGGRVVLANSLRGGYLVNLSREVNGGVPSAIMFRLGGRSTIRGFEHDKIPDENELSPPNDPAFDVKQNFVVPIESLFYLLKSEARIHLFDNIGTTIFYDGGGVRIAGYDFADEYRDAAGFGVNFETPVGSINLEMGFVLDKKENEAPYRFHFSIGSF